MEKHIKLTVGQLRKIIKEEIGEAQSNNFDNLKIEEAFKSYEIQQLLNNIETSIYEAAADIFRTAELEDKSGFSSRKFSHTSEALRSAVREKIVQKVIRHLQNLDTSPGHDYR